MVPAPRNRSRRRHAAPDTSLPTCAVLLDYDNFVITRQIEGIRITLKELAAYLKRYGAIVSAEAYLSPTATSQANIEKLMWAGFRSIACPLGKDGEDTVDEAITDEAMRLIRKRFVERVLIVSRDAKAFRHLTPWALEHGREIRMIDIHDIADRDGPKERRPVPIPRPGRLIQVIVRMRGGMHPKSIKADPDRRFICTVIRLVYAHQHRRKPHQLTLPELKEYVGGQLDRCLKRGNWRRRLAHAVQALVDAGALVERGRPGERHYVLADHDPLLGTCIKGYRK